MLQCKDCLQEIHKVESEIISLCSSIDPLPYISRLSGIKEIIATYDVCPQKEFDDFIKSIRQVIEDFKSNPYNTENNYQKFSEACNNFVKRLKDEADVDSIRFRPLPNKLSVYINNLLKHNLFMNIAIKYVKVVAYQINASTENGKEEIMVVCNRTESDINGLIKQAIRYCKERAYEITNWISVSDDSFNSLGVSKDGKETVHICMANDGNGLYHVDFIQICNYGDPCITIKFKVDI